MLIGYTSLEDANEYVSSRYTSKEEARKDWEALSDNDRSSLLQRSFDAIELLPFTGKKTHPSQPNAFPRNGSKEVPSAVERAQIENALSLADDNLNSEAAFYESMGQWGISSYSIGSLSESSSTGFGSKRVTSLTGITSTKADRLLQPFVSGGYSIKGGCK